MTSVDGSGVMPAKPEKSNEQKHYKNNLKLICEIYLLPFDSQNETFGDRKFSNFWFHG